MIAWLIALSAATAQPALPDSARAPAAVVDAFHAALARGDEAAAGALIADDALIFEEGGAERSKAEYQERHLPADAEFSKAVRFTATRRGAEAAGPLALVTTEGRTSGSFRGKPVDRVTAETMVLRRDAKGWRIVHIHWSSAAQKRPAAGAD